MISEGRFLSPSNYHCNVLTGASLLALAKYMYYAFFGETCS